MSELEYKYDVRYGGINVYYHMNYEQASNYVEHHCYDAAVTDKNIRSLIEAIEDEEDFILRDTIGCLSKGFNAGYYGNEGGIDLDKFGFKALSSNTRKRQEPLKEVVTTFEFGKEVTEHMHVKVEVTREYLQSIMYKYKIEPSSENIAEVERIFLENLDDFKEQVTKGIKFFLWTSDNWYFGIFGSIGESLDLDKKEEE